MKILVTACLFGSLIFSVAAQESRKSVHLGISLIPAMNIASFTRQSVVHKKPLFAMGASGDIYFEMDPQLHFRSGLSILFTSLNHLDYSPEGAIFPDAHTDYFHFDMKYVFIGIPLELKVNLSPKPNHFSFLAGAHFRQEVSTSGNASLRENDIIKIEYDLDESPVAIRPNQTSIFMGVGYEFSIGDHSIFAGPVFEYTTSRIFKFEAKVPRNGHFIYAGLRVSYY